MSAETVVMTEQDQSSAEERTYTAEEMRLLASELEQTKSQLAGAQNRIAEVNEESKQRRLKLEEYERNQAPAPEPKTERPTVRAVEDKIGKLEAELARRDYEDAVRDASERLGTNPRVTRALMLESGVPDLDWSDRQATYTKVESKVQELVDELGDVIRSPQATAQTQKPMYVTPSGVEGTVPDRQTDPKGYLDWASKNKTQEEFLEIYTEMDGDKYIFEGAPPPSIV